MLWFWPIALDIARLVSDTLGQYLMTMEFFTLFHLAVLWVRREKAPKQLSLARALAVENDPRLRQGLAEDKVLKVAFINASDRVMSKQKQQRYKKIKLYREVLQLPKTDFTIMSLPSLVCSFFGLFCNCFWLFLLQVSLCFAKFWSGTLVVHARLF